MKRKTLEERLEQYRTTYALESWQFSCYRAKKHLISKVFDIVIKENAYFITFTIAPKHYHYLMSTYFRKAKEALSQASLYILNEDYGEEKGRFHIHALVSIPYRYDYTTKENIIQQVWPYGNVQFEPIHTPNEKAIGNYINKLSAHATKETAHRIIYSRKKKGFAYG